MSEKELIIEKIKELVSEDKEFAKEVMNALKTRIEKDEIDEIIDMHFKRYDEVFRALA